MSGKDVMFVCDKHRYGLDSIKCVNRASKVCNAPQFQSSSEGPFLSHLIEHFLS